MYNVLHGSIRFVMLTMFKTDCGHCGVGFGSLDTYRYIQLMCEEFSRSVGKIGGLVEKVPISFRLLPKEVRNLKIEVHK